MDESFESFRRSPFHCDERVMLETLTNQRATYMEVKVNSTNKRGRSINQHFSTKLRPRFFVGLLLATCAMVVMAVGVSKIKARPTLHVTFPAATQMLRKVRMFSDFPDLERLSSNHSSLSLVSRLQLLDTRRCRDGPESCKVYVVCDSVMDQHINCRCRQGFYFRDWRCHECSNKCPADHYLVSPCSDHSDAVCKPCTECGKSQYEAAQCTTDRDTICIDVSFPVGILPMNRSYLRDDGITVTVSHSPNMFLERLIDMESLDTPMYVTNNQQTLDFVWPRLSGLEIAVKITDVFLVPDYRDLDSVDDKMIFRRLQDPSQNSKDYYNFVENYYCRHPVPDYYTLQLEVLKNRTSAAQVVRCDSQDENVPSCPSRYKDGDRYLRWDVNTPCPHLNAPLPDQLQHGPNNIVCTEETDLLRHVFGKARPTTEEYMFPSQQCEIYRAQCQNCLKSAKCPPNTVNSSLHQEGLCCGIGCYEQEYCRQAYSSRCPKPQVECAKGEVNIFSLLPVFDSMEHQFACHMKYHPPDTIFSLSYTVRVPTLDYNITAQNFTVIAKSRQDHQRRLSVFDFIRAQHDTRLPIEEELILVGNHMALMHHRESPMKPYVIHRLKTPKQLRQNKEYIRNQPYSTTYIQFERPFLYSSSDWYRNGCHKNMSEIYPNQTIYQEEFLPVMAKKNFIAQPGGFSEDVPHPGLTYQLYHMDKEPFVRFSVKRGSSVLQHLQGTAVVGRLVPNSLYGRATWHHDTQTWNLLFSGEQQKCPTIISVKIFTQLMTGCAGYFDVLINCPAPFTVTFNFSTGHSDLPDIFVIQVNDSHTSHNMVLTSIYPPLYVDELLPTVSAQITREKMNGDDQKKNVTVIWVPIFLIASFSILALIGIFVFHNCVNAKAKRMSYVDKHAEDNESVALNNQGEKLASSPAVFSASATINSPAASSPSSKEPKRKWFINVFIVLYILYSIVFTFSLTFGILYLTHSSVWSNISSPQNLGKELQEHVDKSLAEVKNFEEKEKLRILKAFEERRKACIHHLELENQKLLRDYEAVTKKQIEMIYMENGTLHILTREIQKANVSVYMQQIEQFVTDCNKTVHSIVQRFQANYFQFLRSTALNNWLQVPRQIFLTQDGDDPNRPYLSSNQVKQFASWLEIDKSEELLAAEDNVFGRLNTVTIPTVSALDLSFPSARETPPKGPPLFESGKHRYFYTALEPHFRNFSEEQLGRDYTSVQHYSRTNRDASEAGDILDFGLSGNLPRNPDLTGFSESEVEPDNETKVGNDTESSKVIEKNPESEKISETEKTQEAIYNLQLGQIAYKSLEDQEILSNVIVERPLTAGQAEALVSNQGSNKSEESSKENRKLVYILVAVFLTLDLVLWVYRFSWLSTQLHAARHGYADRIPTDDACKQVLEIQTAYHLPAFEDNHEELSSFYVDGKEQLYVSDHRDTDMTFLQIPKARDKDDILQKIWNEKMNASDHRAAVRMRKFFLVRWCEDMRTVATRLFLSQLVWQASVTALAILALCLLVYSAEFWLTADNFRVLVGGQSAAADVQWQLDSSDRYLQGLASQLTRELGRLQVLCDMEVNLLTDLYFATVNMQTSVFRTTLTKLCHEAKGNNCDQITSILEPIGGRIVGCNFLPLQAQTFLNESLTYMEWYRLVSREVTPLLSLSRQMLSVVSSFLVFLLCARLLCQAGASTLRHYLLVTGRLPRVKVYQSEEHNQTLNRSGMPPHVIQRSQSWVDSCESGVYVGETDEANKEEANR